MITLNKLIPIAIVTFVVAPLVLSVPIPGSADKEGTYVCGGSDREKIMNALNDHPEGLTSGEVEDITGYGMFRVSSELGCLEDTGKVRVRDPGFLQTEIYISNEADKE